MTNSKRKRLYLDMDETGQKYASVVEYDLIFNKEGFLVNVFNEFNNSVSKDSECWIYFDNLYNNL